MSQTARSSVKDRILEAAKDEFSQAGVSKVTMEEIAERAGMGKASIYYYFRTKDALLKAVILREYEEFSRRLEEILPTKTSAADKLRAYEEKRFSYFNKLMAFKLVELAPSLKVKPALLDMFDEFARREMKLIRRVIQEGKDNGEFDIVSVDRIARAFLHLVRGLRLCRIREARGKRIGPETLAQLRRELDLVTGIFLRGIAGTVRLAPAARSAMSRPRAGPSRHVAPHPAPRDQAETKPGLNRTGQGCGAAHGAASGNPAAPMSRNARLIVIGGAAILVIGGTVLVKVIGHSSSDDMRRLNAPLVQTEPARRDTVLYQLKFTGDVIPIQQATIIAKVGGTLERVFVDMGTQVKENQILALIDTVELSQQYQQMSASYTNARINYDRTKQLAEQNLLARQDLDNAEAAMKVSKANYEMAKTRLAYARITAPFSGTVTKRNLDPGALLSANNTAIFTLMDLDAMKIVVNVLEKNIPLVSIGRKAVLKVDAFPTKQFEGSIARFSDAVDLSTRTMAVQIDIPNPDHLLKPGMFASVMLVVDVHPDAITVPTAALLKDEKGFFVYAVNGNSAHRKQVTPGIEQSGRTEILAGVDGSEAIITTGQQFVKDGAPVALQH